MFDNVTGRPKCEINVLYGMCQYITQWAERKPIVYCTERKRKKEVSDTNSPQGKISTPSVSSPVHTTLDKFKNGGFTLKTHQMFSVHTTLDKFKNGGFTLKTHQMFSVHTTLEEFKNAAITAHLGFVLCANFARDTT